MLSLNGCYGYGVGTGSDVSGWMFGRFCGSKSIKTNLCHRNKKVTLLSLKNVCLIYSLLIMFTFLFRFNIVPTSLSTSSSFDLIYSPVIMFDCVSFHGVGGGYQWRNEWAQWKTRRSRRRNSGSVGVRWGTRNVELTRNRFPIKFNANRPDWTVIRTAIVLSRLLLFTATFIKQWLSTGWPSFTRCRR